MFDPWSVLLSHPVPFLIAWLSCVNMSSSAWPGFGQDWNRNRRLDLSISLLRNNISLLLRMILKCLLETVVDEGVILYYSKWFPERCCDGWGQREKTNDDYRTPLQWVHSCCFWFLFSRSFYLFIYYLFIAVIVFIIYGLEQKETVKCNFKMSPHKREGSYIVYSYILI